ncbi:MAG: alpha-amylase family glycosyl hydrolase [Ilumatobacteraceae bacterium]
MAARWHPERRTWTITMWSSAATDASVVVVDRDDPFVAVGLVQMELGEADVWSAEIVAADVGEADLYGFRVDGPPDGFGRFDPAKLLLDPEANEVWFPPAHSRELARVHGADTLGRSPFAVLPHGGVRPPATRGQRHSTNDLVIYEAHVRGLTALAPHVPVGERGTFAGLRHHIEHLVSLGITAVELLPVHQFDPDEGNYWGYMPLAWSALHHGYVAGHDPDREFVEMIQAFHDVDIEVILDVVYNHTTEEDIYGPTFNLRSIDDAAYYVLHDDGTYRDDAGCGNVIRAAHPAASKLILDSLHRFADLGVDGFRFDLGSLLGRDIDGAVQHDSELIDRITALGVERDVRMIVEAWDLSAYQVGDAFPGRSWAQWNGPFRDQCRSFLRAEPGAAAGMALALAGSPQLYGDDIGRSINFITAHDGFTLYDLVSYERKHNLANGQNGDDGTDENRSWNCGWEGDDIPADIDSAVRALRLQQMQNAFVLLILAAGVPMFVAGDEFANTQHGNNNPYNQDNEITWLDWDRPAEFASLTDFVRSLIALRKSHGDGPVVLHGVDSAPDLGFSSHSIAWERGDLYIVANVWWEPLEFVIHATGEWTVALSSSAATGALDANRITVAPRSTAVLTRT